jgi:glycine oxidase
MLAPFAEAHGPGPFVRLGAESLCRYPAFIDAVRQAAGDDGDPLLQISGAGMLRVARHAADADRLDTLYAWQQGMGFGVERLTGEAARRREPMLASDVTMSIYSPQERQVDPRRLRRSLVAACCRLGGDLREAAPVTQIVERAEGYRVIAGDATLECGTVVLAGGVWGPEIAQQIGFSLPVKPVKGQILALRPAGNSGIDFSHTVYAPDIYLVPRPDGRVIVGATEEPNAGFDVQTHAEDIESLRQRAVAWVPSLATASLDGPAWAGLRPSTPDSLPILGSLPEHPNLHLAAGHFRNGILLTPITGEIIAHGILRGEPHPLLAAEFRPERFAL